MKFDFKNIVIGVAIGILSTIIVSCFLSDVYIDIRIGDNENIDNNLIE